MAKEKQEKELETSSKADTSLDVAVEQQEEAMDVDGEEEEEPQEQIALKLADAGIAWKKLSDSEKEPFMEMARKDKNPTLYIAVVPQKLFLIIPIFLLICYS